MALRPDPADPERVSERRRRREDAVRLVPILGTLLFLFPLLLGESDGWSTAWVGLYLFAIWGLLIALIGWMSSRTVAPTPPPPEPRQR